MYDTIRCDDIKTRQTVIAGVTGSYDFTVIDFTVIAGVTGFYDFTYIPDLSSITVLTLLTLLPTLPVSSTSTGQRVSRASRDASFLDVISVNQ